MDYLNIIWILPSAYFGVSTLTLITRMFHLMEMNLSGKANTSEMVIVICGTKSINFLALRLLIL